MRILITEPDSYSSEALAIYHRCGEVNLGARGESGTFDLDLEDVEVLVIRLGVLVDRSLMERAPSLRVVISPTTGLDHIDLEAAKERGVQVISLQGETDFLRSIPATAELTWGLLLALVRRIVPAVNAVREGFWNRELFRGTDLRGRTLGILGCGRVGSMVAEFGRVFGMEVLGFDVRPSHLPAVSFVSLDELLARSDVLSVHLPLNQTTIGMVDESVFTRMKTGALLLNTSRGGIVQEKALLNALQEGKLGGAALDVLNGETGFAGRIPPEHMLVEYALSSENLLITPHIGGASFDSMAATEIFCAKRYVELFGLESVSS